MLGNRLRSKSIVCCFDNLHRLRRRSSTQPSALVVWETNKKLAINEHVPPAPSRLPQIFRVNPTWQAKEVTSLTILYSTRQWIEYGFSEIMYSNEMSSFWLHPIFATVTEFPRRPIFRHHLRKSTRVEVTRSHDHWLSSYSSHFVTVGLGRKKVSKAFLTSKYPLFFNRTRTKDHEIPIIYSPSSSGPCGCLHWPLQSRPCPQFRCVQIADLTSDHRPMVSQCWI